MSLFSIISEHRCHLLSIPHCNACIHDRVSAQIRLNTQLPNDIICGILKATKLNYAHPYSCFAFHINNINTHNLSLSLSLSIHSIIQMPLSWYRTVAHIVFYFVSLFLSFFFLDRSFVDCEQFIFCEFQSLLLVVCGDIFFLNNHKKKCQHASSVKISKCEK